MNSQIVVRISSEVKDKFFDVAENNGTVAATLIRGWINEYIEEHSVVEKEDEVQIMSDAGRAMQKELGGFNKSRFYGSKLNNVLRKDPSKFIHEVTAMHTQHEVRIPTELLRVRENENLGYAYIIGLLSID